jgi:hypothetical protein
MYTQTMHCRCGYSGEGEHPCHYNEYSCRKPAKHRFYSPKAAVLAGLQFKLEVLDTWACDECWERFQLENNDVSIQSRAGVFLLDPGK